MDKSSDGVSGKHEREGDLGARLIPLTAYCRRGKALWLNGLPWPAITLNNVWLINRPFGDGGQMGNKKTQGMLEVAAGPNRCRSARTGTGKSLGSRGLQIGQGSQKEFPPGWRGLEGWSRRNTWSAVGT